MNKKYWLRGGLWTGIILSLWNLIYMVFFPRCFGGGCTYKDVLNTPIFPYVLALSAGIFVCGFAAGSVLGWLYGKIKNRNHAERF
ncbi:MAG TPA: hypothetical protein VJH55_02320 [Candidatus Paceibacterota bacterium]